MEKLYTIKETYEYLGMKRTSLHKYTKMGLIKSYKYAGSRRYSESQIQAFLKLCEERAKQRADKSRSEEYDKAYWDKKSGINSDTK